MDILESVMKWIVAPVAAFVWLLHTKTQQHATEIAVIKATQQANKEAPENPAALIGWLPVIEWP